MTAFAFAYIDYLIGLDWSPEQISGALTQRGWLDVPSHEWIYQYIYQDKSKGGKLHLHGIRRNIENAVTKTRIVGVKSLIKQVFTAETRSLINDNV
jgi:IS30 family transposase